MEPGKILTVLLWILASLLIGCESKKVANKADQVRYENILVFSDLTNRTTNPNYIRPLHDTIVIDKLIDFFKNDVVRPGRTINPRHILAFQKINSFRNDTCGNIISRIDLSAMENGLKKSKYVNSTMDGNNLSIDLASLKRYVACKYGYTDISGDLLQSLDKNLILDENVKKCFPVHDSINEIIKVWRNTIILFTDGYLEFNGMQNSPFSTFDKIRRIRQLCSQLKTDPEQVLKNYPEYRLKPISNPAFNHSRLLLFETFDRTINRSTGFSNEQIPDEIILKSLWKDWSKSSGFLEFEYFKFFVSENEITPRLKNIFRR